MEEPKREEAGFIRDFKENQMKEFKQLLKARRLRLRSPVFDLPEFDEKPLVSMVVLVNSKAELKRAEAFIKQNDSNKDIQMALLCVDDLTLQEFGKDEFTSYKVNLEEANRAAWLNQFAVKMSGKIICLISTPENFDVKILFEMTARIKSHTNNQICLHDFQKRITGIAMASDAFYLARGLDELIEDVEISILDLGLRLEMLGCQVNSSIWPMPGVPSLAEKNIRNGRLTVNQGLGAFSDFR